MPSEQLAPTRPGSPMGQSIPRREDARLLTGHGHYTADVNRPGQLYAVMVRSPHAHAHIRSIRTDAARAVAGVAAIYTGTDVAGRIAPIPTAWIPPGSDLAITDHPALADTTVRYVGDGVAMVVAESLDSAREARALIDVDYEPLGAVTSVADAMREGAPRVHEGVSQNVALHWRAGSDPSAVDHAMKTAEVVVRQAIVQQRLVPNPMEPRAAVAEFDAAAEALTLWVTSQNPHIHRLLVAGVLGLAEHRVRVIAQDVGGDLAVKSPAIPMRCWWRLPPEIWGGR